MKAMVLTQIASLEEQPDPLQLVDLPIPQPRPGEVLLKVSACGVCHTELDEIEGRTPPASLPMVLGHQVVGRVSRLGAGVTTFQPGDRLGVAWIFSACGECEYCRKGEENLCPAFQATGRDAPGGYAEYMTVPAKFAFHLPEIFTDAEAAPLLCAGAIGYRSLRLTSLQDGQPLGLVGFGASAHIVLKLAQEMFPHSPVYVQTRSPGEQQFARQLGATWAGGFDQQPPELWQAAIDTTPVWKPVLAALSALRPGGRLVINAIRKETVDQAVWLELDYPRHLWMEKEIKSVANVSRRDVQEFLELAGHIPIRPEFQTYPLEQANQALRELKNRQIRGAKVLIIE